MTENFFFHFILFHFIFEHSQKQQAAQKHCNRSVRPSVGRSLSDAHKGRQMFGWKNRLQRITQVRREKKYVRFKFLHMWKKNHVCV